jgi:hypothetical protein
MATHIATDCRLTRHCELKEFGCKFVATGKNAEGQMEIHMHTGATTHVGYLATTIKTMKQEQANQFKPPQFYLNVQEKLNTVGNLWNLYPLHNSYGRSLPVILISLLLFAIFGRWIARLIGLASCYFVFQKLTPILGPVYRVLLALILYLVVFHILL